MKPSCFSFLLFSVIRIPRRLQIYPTKYKLTCALPIIFLGLQKKTLSSCKMSPYSFMSALSLLFYCLVSLILVPSRYSMASPYNPSRLTYSSPLCHPLCQTSRFVLSSSRLHYSTIYLSFTTTLSV